MEYLNSDSVNADDIRVETIAPQPAVTGASIVRFYPDEDIASTALLVEFSSGIIVSICEIELIQSADLIDESDDFVPTALKTALDTTISEIPEECKQCCDEELRKLFENNIGEVVSNIDTNRNNVISGQNNIVRATGAALALISVPAMSGSVGAAVSLCFASSVQFSL